jgi:hypothetical protein
MSGRFLRRAAKRLAAHAGRALPRNRAEWAKAMRHETDHVPNGAAAFVWALGCVFASYLERIRVMRIGNARVSPWVLCLEMALCFVPLTWMFAALVSRGAFGFAGPIPIDAWFLNMLFSTTLGPIGLIVAFRVVVLNRRSFGWFTLAALCLPAAWTLLEFAVAFGRLMLSSGYPVEATGGLILFAALPAVGVAHLVYLARPEQQIPAAV